MNKLIVADVLLPLDNIPVVGPTTLLKKTLEIMVNFQLGVASIVDDDGKLAGIFTDGDVRRMLLNDQRPFPALFADDIIQHTTRRPTTIRPTETLINALAMMESKKVWDLPVVLENGTFIGLLHLHHAIQSVIR
jgi:arabinose-5-phosphate isomerase